MRGRIDGVFEGVLRGWVWDPNEPGARITVELRLDGEPLAQLRAALPRPDLEQAGMGDGSFGLEFALPIRCQDDAVHELALMIHRHDRLITLDQLSVRIPRRLHMLRGKLERVAAGRVLGWIWDQSRPDTPVELELAWEREVVARFRADGPRADLARARIGSGRHGFSFDLAALVEPPPEGALLELRSHPDFGEWSLGGFAMPALIETESHDPEASSEPRIFLEKARLAEGRRDQAEAARILDHGLRLHPKDFELLNIRARVHLSLQEMETAERVAWHALTLRPGHPRPLVLLARIATALGRHEDAVAHWAGIPPEDSAYRERLAKRGRSLLALGRPAEAMAEMSLAARHRPDDPEALRGLAETAEAMGALRSARAHWRSLLDRSPTDRAAADRLAALELRMVPAIAGSDVSPLRNAALRDWSGSIPDATEGEARPAPGLILRALGEGARLRFSPVLPREDRPGELPGYGIWLHLEGGGAAEAVFALGRTDAAWRMGIEWQAGAGCTDLPVSLALRRDGMEDRILLRGSAGPRARLLRFDLPEEAASSLVLRLEAPGTLLLRPPRPLAQLHAAAAPGGFEASVLEGQLALPPRRPRANAAMAEIGYPFTTISIAARPDAVPDTIRAVLRETSVPFECVLVAQPGWPEALVAALGELGALDPRFRLLLRDAAPAEGWVARVEAPPEERGWLAKLHRRASDGTASAPGVSLSWQEPA
ncbi:MAG: hypothetical protein JWR10_1897 [Rubritepida sp.]|nr:hypothetical protein [Rubritepida sp.]